MLLFADVVPKIFRRSLSQLTLTTKVPFLVDFPPHWIDNLTLITPPYHTPRLNGSVPLWWVWQVVRFGPPPNFWPLCADKSSVWKIRQRRSGLSEALGRKWAMKEIWGDYLYYQPGVQLWKQGPVGGERDAQAVPPVMLIGPYMLL